MKSLPLAFTIWNIIDLCLKKINLVPVLYLNGYRILKNISISIRVEVNSTLKYKLISDVKSSWFVCIRFYSKPCSP